MPLPWMMPMQDLDLRPRYHFTAPSGWLNDPNGLVYENGNYHLFYQHTPEMTSRGIMIWGHAVSHDLLHWKNLPDAIEPDQLGSIWSGSAVIDHRNDSGLGKNAMLCFYTAAGGVNPESAGQPFTQCLVYSTDGKTFNKYSGNPVVANITHEDRDPKVVWDPQSKQWIMALYLDGGRYGLLGSHDLKSWQRLSDVATPGTDECPDFFQMPLDGNPRHEKWIFWGANGRYFVGTFDGKEFHPEGPMQPSYFGNTNYAAQTYSDAPHGRRIQIAWMAGSTFPGCAWNQQMSTPCELNLKTVDGVPRLFSWPVHELDAARSRPIHGKDGVYDVPSGLVDAEGGWDIPKTGSLSLSINGTPMRFDAASRTLECLGKQVVLDFDVSRLQIRALADRASLEVFVQEGQFMMPFYVIPAEGSHRGADLKTDGDWKGDLRVYDLRI